MNTAVNHISVVNAGTGLAPVIQGVGTDTNVGTTITPKGTGTTTITAGGLAITAGGLTITAGNVQLAGHISTTGTIPVVAAGAQASAAAITAGSTDIAGSLTATTVAVPAAGALLTVTFATAYGAAPKTVILMPYGATVLDLQPSSIATTGFTVTITGTLPAGNTAFTIGYFVVA